MRREVLFLAFLLFTISFVPAVFHSPDFGYTTYNSLDECGVIRSTNFSTVGDCYGFFVYRDKLSCDSFFDVSSTLERIELQYCVASYSIRANDVSYCNLLNNKDFGEGYVEQCKIVYGVQKEGIDYCYSLSSIGSIRDCLGDTSLKEFAQSCEKIEQEHPRKQCIDYSRGSFEYGKFVRDDKPDSYYFYSFSILFFILLFSTLIIRFELFTSFFKEWEKYFLILFILLVILIFAVIVTYHDYGNIRYERLLFLNINIGLANSIGNFSFFFCYLIFPLLSIFYFAGKYFKKRNNWKIFLRLPLFTLGILFVSFAVLNPFTSLYPASGEEGLGVVILLFLLPLVYLIGSFILALIVYFYGRKIVEEVPAGINDFVLIFFLIISAISFVVSLILTYFYYSL